MPPYGAKMGPEGGSTQVNFPVPCTAQGAPPMVGNVPRTKPQQEDLVKTHISPKPLRDASEYQSI